MRIAVATTSYPRRPGDFAGAFVRDLNVALRSLGGATMTFAPGADLTDDLADDAGGPVVRIEPPGPIGRGLFYGDGMEANVRREGRVAALRSLRSYGSALRRALEREGPFDVVLAHWLVPTAVWLAGRVAPPLIGVCHGGDAHVLARPCLGRLAGGRLEGRLAGVLAVSRAAAEIVRLRTGLSAAQVPVAPMGVDAEAFAPDLRVPREPDLIAAVGRLLPVKGFDVLIRAVEGLVLRDGRRPRVIILGDGPERDRLAAAALSCGVALTLPGTATRSAVADLYRRAAVVVVPSVVLPDGRTEGAPVVALEALSAGAPTIASATGGLSDVFPPASLAPPGDLPALRRLLERALRDPDRFRVPDAAARFDRRRVADVLIALCRAGMR